MRVLVVYYRIPERVKRNTVDEHLYSFRKYSSADVYYLNAFSGIPAFIDRVKFDLVLYHYTFCSCKWDRDSFQAKLKRWSRLKRLSGYKAAFPQDEYVNTDLLNFFFKEFGIKTVFTCLPESEWQKVYPSALSGLEHYITVLTGYVDEDAVAEILQFDPARTKDIGYRARKNPYWLGRHAVMKWNLANIFLQATSGSTLQVDISTNDRDAFSGHDWYSFLASCRVVLGCEGGASLHDPDGSIRCDVDRYIVQHPQATFDEVERECFAGQDGNLALYAISPRHFEACITKSCQVLVEGEYSGVLSPGIHYIEIKKDWSNIAEVIEAIEDVSFCEEIAENAYRDIIESGRYTYRVFVSDVYDHCARHMAPAIVKGGGFFLILLKLRLLLSFVFESVNYLFAACVYFRKRPRAFLHKLLRIV